MSRKAFVFGVGKKTRRILKAFDGLENYISGFLDNNSSIKEYKGMAVVRPDDVADVIKKTNIVIMTEDRYFDEIRTQLTEKIGVDAGKIWSAEEWVAECLKYEGVIIHPHKIRLDVSTRCQLNCTGCYMRRFNNGVVGLGMMRFEDFRDIVSENDIEEIEISNSGEPFLNPDLIKMLEFAHKKEIAVTVNNGSNFNNVSDELLDALVRCEVRIVRCSIDGASEEVYSKYRRGGDYIRVIHNIERLIEVKKRYASKYPEMIWQYILMNGNECDIEKAKDEAGRLGMRIGYKLDWSGNFTPQNPERIKRVCGIDLITKHISDNDSIKRWESVFCQLMVYQPQINWDGRLLGCCKVYRNDWGINAFETGFIDAVNSDAYREAVMALLNGRSAMPEGTPCDECKTYQLAAKEKERSMAL